MEQVLSHVPVLVGMLAFLPLEDTLRNVMALGRLWHFAALQPGALAGHLRLRGEYSACSTEKPDPHSTPPMGLQKLLGRGCLKEVDHVEIAEPCSWLPDVLSKLPALRRLRISGAPRGRDAADVEWALSSILSVATQLTALEFSYHGFSAPSGSIYSWPKTPALRKLSVQQMPLSLWDLPGLFSAHGLEILELQACPLTESQMGIVHCGARVHPKEVTMIDCGGKMALTLLLSLGLNRLCYLCVDEVADAKLQEELSKACRPSLGGVDPDVEAAADLQTRAERELRAELRRAQRHEGVEADLGPWRPLFQWLQAADRKRCHGEVQYRSPK
eukprot:s816_g11.t1